MQREWYCIVGVITMELKDIIKERRIALNLTQKEIADYVGVSEATISRWESGNIKNMRRDKLYKLSKILQVKGSVLTDDDSSTGSMLADDIFHASGEVKLNIPEFELSMEDIELIDCFHRASPEAQNIIRSVLAPYKQDTSSKVG